MLFVIFNFADLKLLVAADGIDAAFYELHDHCEFQGILADGGGKGPGEGSGILQVQPRIFDQSMKARSAG